jgi:hypothetical protein
MPPYIMMTLIACLCTCLLQKCVFEWAKSGWTGIIHSQHHMESPRPCRRQQSRNKPSYPTDKSISHRPPTPLCHQTYCKTLGPLEWNNASKQILNGTFDIDSIISNVDIQNIVKAMLTMTPTTPREQVVNSQFQRSRQALSLSKRAPAQTQKDSTTDIGNP